MQMLTDVLAMFLCTLFVISAVSKIAHLSAFRELTVAYGVLPAPIARGLGILLPFAELSGAALLCHGGTSLYGSLVLLVLLLGFAWAVSTVLRAKKNVSCGCYGKFLDASADRFTLFKIGVLAAAALIVMIRSFSHPVHPSPGSILLGSFLTACLLAAQAVWAYHAKVMDRLKNR
ncbi:MAG: MauE/DoxX family redox-associated membrane protein [Planifilum fimeticola]